MITPTPQSDHWKHVQWSGGETESLAKGICGCSLAANKKFLCSVLTHLGSQLLKSTVWSITVALTMY